MKMLFLLILLSQNGAGDITASFVNTETLEQCQQKEQMVKAIFTTAELPILESRCMASDLRFSEFGHAVSSSTPRHFYLIRFEQGSVAIQQMPDWRSCMLGQREREGKGWLYCASSIQSIQD
jgi:hypothetical protein